MDADGGHVLPEQIMESFVSTTSRKRKSSSLLGEVSYFLLNELFFLGPQEGLIPHFQPPPLQKPINKFKFPSC
jgi:hypothetical protein